jgi:DNA-binding XRE family transcriptional regulator
MKYPDMYPDMRGLYSVNSAQIIRTMRKDAGLTQKKLAEKVRLSKKSIENYEKGVDVPFNKLVGIMDVCRIRKFTIDLVAGKIKVEVGK